MKKLPLLLMILILSISNTFSQTKVTFYIDGLPKDSMQQIGIRGNIPPLDWGKSIPLASNGKNSTITLDFPATGELLEFKFVRYNDDTTPSWENIQNRTLVLKANDNVISENRWNREQLVDISTLPPLYPKGLKEDFELIKTMVLNVHPGTYRYNNKQQITTALSELEEAFSQPLTYGEAYLAISKLTAQLKCDHTKAGFNNQNKIINSIIHYQKNKVPFTFKWLDSLMIVTHNASGSELLKRGTIINAVNGVNVKAIQEQMLQYVGADGATDQNRVYKLEVNGYDFRYNAFDIFFPLKFPFPDDSLILEIQEPGKEVTQNVTVTTLTREERAQILADRYPNFPKTRDDFWQFELLDDSIGILTINSFGLFGWKAMTIDYKAFLAEAFAKLNQNSVQHLIIDIRKNTGGADEMADELFKYLSPTSYQFAREGRTRYLEFPESLKPHVQTWGDAPWYYKLNPKVATPVDGYYFFKENFAAKEQKTDKELFQGQIYLLTSAANTSLAFYTANKFQKQELGVSIGQETGGNLNDINGGQILFLRLPYSKIEIDFPVMGGFTTVPQPNTGVQPDIITTYTLKDISENKDVEMDVVLKSIKG